MQSPSEGKKQLIVEFPDIFWAHWIHEQGTSNDCALRWAVEASILARQTDEEIARTLGCWLYVIAAYESLYFQRSQQA